MGPHDWVVYESATMNGKGLKRTVKANVRAIMRYLDALDPVTRREVIEEAATYYQTRRAKQIQRDGHDNRLDAAVQQEA